MSDSFAFRLPNSCVPYHSAASLLHFTLLPVEVIYVAASLVMLQRVEPLGILLHCLAYLLLAMVPNTL